MKLSLLFTGCLSAGLAVLVPAVASAQDGQPVVTERTTSEATGPSMAMVGSGIVIFGLSYLPVVAVGSTSGLDADRTLFVPLAGPWMDLTQRPGCSGSGSACNTENANKVLLITDGVFQAIGALTVLGGFLTTAHETKTVKTASDGITWHVAPTSVGSGYGIATLGSF